ncbi:hypothetical protein LTR78_000048 [Recurvomyces mirabilis]|uniref:PFU domain-containing protein n=1 Tax=Recurvomyces mirabilis TaxID=574656 RepID=A0AAE0WX00_9PEZI|nr:hypothetical protein LTR78_000048 [Recurvomyces mirabilis]KAK5161704.1 hypothetical protein LTS14_000049 [Recurvomyces mirabilis]
MDPQQDSENVFHFQARPKPTTKTFTLKVDLHDGKPPQDLVYRNDESPNTTARKWLEVRGLDHAYINALRSMIYEQTGGQKIQGL